MSDSADYDPTTDVGKVRMKIGDREYPFLLEDSEINALLTEANSCVNGAAGLALLALAATKADAWASVNAGSVSRSKVDPRRALQELAERYINMSDEVSLNAQDDVVFGTARVDWKLEYTEDAQRLREFAEDEEA